ncbi:MAG TPA: 2Fe-2S iron-sulfur cluster-binding protein, partial [Casimicrobiaceae bacterium]|nr:2Fe-2S iron-sulfur cluster-binding protein [Casimicrobiaceae bacterium]
MNVEMVTLTIDDREVTVPKGTGLVEAALAAGIEIPVFCYEPRLGAPVGACRMCLCEVAPGPPKPQAACTLTAAEGMSVRTALTSEIARDAQNGTLEFILVNHPLDCPVCDKGGECPLQDLTFRYGPGNTRMTFPKRTFEKPIPVSPLIALDRERCILCYRCTRFSSDVAEDSQLVAINRGSQSVIATFEDEPYRAPFSGNVIELCPVGALTSTQYRFEARPWEIQNTPTVCGLCPVGCNISATTREGKVKRILSRNHPEVDQGWLCDKGRFAYGHLNARDRIAAPLVKVGPRRFEQVTWEDALDRVESLLRDSGAATVTALSGGETVEQAYGLGRLLRAGLGAHTAVLPEEVPDNLDAKRAPLSALREAKTIAVATDEPVVERAPVVDLWLKAARRAGAKITYGVPSSKVDALVTDDAACADSCDAANVYYLPRTPNGRGVYDAWSAASDNVLVAESTPRLLIVSGDEAATDPNVRALAADAETVIGIGMFEESFRGLADIVLPGTSYLERDGTTINLEGRLQRQRRAVMAPCPDELAWIAKLAERFGVELSAHASLVFGELSPRLFGGISFGDVGEIAALPPRAAASAPTKVPGTKVAGTGLRLVAYRPLFSGAAVDRTPELDFQKPDAEVQLAAADAKSRGITNGQSVTVSSNGTSVELRARVAKDLAAGVIRIAQEH